MQLTVILILAMVFTFLLGFRDSSNTVSTIIFSRAMHPRAALLLTAAAEFAGPFLFGTAVARTLGENLLRPGTVSPLVLIAALGAAILWNLITWYIGIPSSSSHALVGGLLGGALAAAGAQAVLVPGLVMVLAALFLGPLLGLAAGYLFTLFVFFLSRNASLKINWFFRNGQILTGVGLALAHGANEGQKMMGVITLGLISAGAISQFQVPEWVIAASAGAIALGTALSGWRLIRTVGGRFFKIRPVDGFCSQVSSAIVIFAAAMLGGPVSTTQVVNSAIMGVGSAHRVNKVRWGTAGQILIAWVLTIPAAGLLAAGVFLLLNWIV